jgi:predicted N-acetyltransferase YhbS
LLPDWPVTGRGIEIRLLGPADDIEAELDLRRRAFGPIAAGTKPGWLASVQRSVDAAQMFGAFDGARLVASARYFPMRQWWHGRAIPMAGVAGVKVAPEERGRGVGRALMTRLIEEISARGFPVSALYPATMPLYRSLGWEIAGGKYETVLAARALSGLIPPDCASAACGPVTPGLRRATTADGAAVVDVLGAVYQSQRDCGPATHEFRLVADWLDDEDRFAYLAADGFLTYRWADGTSAVQVDLLTAASPATVRAFWQILASHASMADTVRACLSPDDPVSWLTREPEAATRQEEPWMLRIVDVGAAVAARGFPTAAAVTAQLEITDDVRPENTGLWNLQISGGTATMARGAGAGLGSRAAPGGPPAPAGPAVSGGPDPAGGPVAVGGPLRLGARGFAALFAGVRLGTLRRAGLAAGGNPAADDALDCAFGGQPAFMLHGF